jgi:Spy/CpxP family protein refolding chaperone
MMHKPVKKNGYLLAMFLAIGLLGVTPGIADAQPAPDQAAGAPGYGPGMMGGYGGGYGMGPGMMGGYGPGYGQRGFGILRLPSLTDQQRQQIVQIENGLRKKNWPLMGKLMDEEATLREMYSTGEPNPAAVGAQYRKISALRQQMLENAVAAHNRIDGLLTKEQRGQLQQYGPLQ